MTRFSIGLGAALALAAASAPLQGSAAVPTRMSFTARVADAGTPVTGAHDFVFRLFDAASGGTELWQESHPGLTVSAGVVNATLGATTPLPAGIFNGAPLHLEVTYDATTLSPRLDVLTVAYAMRADTADDALQCVNATSADHATSADSAAVAATADSATVAVSATTAGSVPWSGVTGVPFTSSGGDNGVDALIARGDHLHDARYYTETEVNAAFGVVAASVYTKTNLQTPGQAAVHWANVTSKPTLACTSVTESLSVAPGAYTGIVEACCPAGTVVTGGGFLPHATFDWVIFSSLPWGNCWQTEAINTGSITQSYDCFARCCSL